MVKGLAKGSAAEYLLVDGEACARKPPNVSFDHAASVSLVAATAVLAFRTCGLQEIGASRRDGPRVLITRGSGGVGTCAIQLAKEMFGASFVATTASGAKAETCRDLGADWVVDFRVESVAAALTSDEEAQRFDAIIDCSGEAAALAAAPLLRRGGALCSISAAPTKEAVREWIRAMVPVAARHEARPGEEPRLQRVPCQPWCVPRPGVTSLINSWAIGAAIDTITGAAACRSKCAAQGASFHHVIASGDGGIMCKIAGTQHQMPPPTPLNLCLCAKICRTCDALVRVRVSRPAHEEIKLRRAAAELMRVGKLRGVVHKQYPLSQGKEAMAELEGGRVLGKIVLQVWDGSRI
jgi:NADPH:quinone reductase-like Zn-dependent oxidoreductase